MYFNKTNNKTDHRVNGCILGDGPTTFRKNCWYTNKYHNHKYPHKLKMYLAAHTRTSFSFTQTVSKTLTISLKIKHKSF